MCVFAILSQKKNLSAVIHCRICDAKYQAIVTELTEPVDVYCEWIDACEDANRRNALSANLESRYDADQLEEDDEDEDEIQAIRRQKLSHDRSPERSQSRARIHSS